MTKFVMSSAAVLQAARYG